MNIEAMKQVLEALNDRSSLTKWQTAREALRQAIEQAENYQHKNPLGGPAKVFDAMADAIRAGDDYHATLRSYGFLEREDKKTIDCSGAAGPSITPLNWHSYADKQRALDKKAENARELGLDYEPVQAEKQEPVAWMFDQAKYGPTDLRGQQWRPALSWGKPYTEDGTVRGLTPLYAQPLANRLANQIETSSSPVIQFPRHTSVLAEDWTIDPAFLLRVKHTIAPDHPAEFTPSMEEIETTLLALEAIPSNIYTTPQPQQAEKQEPVKEPQPDDFDQALRLAIATKVEKACAEALKHFMNDYKNGIGEDVIRAILDHSGSPRNIVENTVRFMQSGRLPDEPRSISSGRGITE